jgi:N-acetylmuramoyl-L-alanine amidase
MIAICIGHSRIIKGRYDGGAYSPFLKINERDFNLQVASIMQVKLAKRDIDSKIYSHYHGSGYGAAMQDIADQIKDDKATLAVELHFNSATPTARGHEWLYWETSKRGKMIAESFEEAFSAAFPQIPSRGIKPIGRASRGGTFLRNTHCPAIITEPFFGSNDTDCRLITPHLIASTYVTALSVFLKRP